MPVRPDLRPGTRLTNERIVARHAALALDPHALAQVVGQVLCRLKLEPFTCADEQYAIRGEGKTRSEVVATRNFRLLPKDHRHIVQRRGSLIELSPRHGSRGRVIRTWLRIAEIDQAVRSEVRIKCHVQQAPLTMGVDGRYILHRSRGRAVPGDDAQPSRTF